MPHRAPLEPHRAPIGTGKGKGDRPGRTRPGRPFPAMRRVHGDPPHVLAIGRDRIQLRTSRPGQAAPSHVSDAGLRPAGPPPQGPEIAARAHAGAEATQGGPARVRPSSTAQGRPGQQPTGRNRRLDGAPPSPQPRARGGTEETAGGGTTPSGVDRIAPSGATALRPDTDRGSAGRRRRRRYRDRSRCSRPPPPVSP